MAKIHATDPAVAGALADWLAGVVAVEGTPDARMREALPPGVGAGESRRPPVHAPHGELPCARSRRTPACSRARRRSRSWRSAAASSPPAWPAAEREAAAATRRTSPCATRRSSRHGSTSRQRQKALHDAQIENVKLGAGAGALPRAQRAGARGARRGARRGRARRARLCRRRAGSGGADRRRRSPRCKAQAEAAREALRRRRERARRAAQPRCSRPSARRRTRCSASASARPRSPRSTTRCA